MTVPTNTRIAHEIDQLPELLRPGVMLWFEKLTDRDGKIAEDYMAEVVRAVACSEFAGNTILRENAWFTENVESFSRAPKNEDLEAFVASIATSERPVAELKSELRRFRNRYLLHVLWREVQCLSDLDETLTKLSLLADRLLDGASQYAERQLRPRFGRVRNADGDVVTLLILGMGKLGGRELNFSSDIDVIFCYPSGGESDGKRTLSAQEYFTRLSRQIIALIDEVTVDGFVFRMDTRLRPFGDSGPPVVSFAALESYLLEHGRDWERYAYVKARLVGQRPTADVEKELQTDLIQPFVYRRYVDFGVFESVRKMHSLIAAQVKRRDLADNVKLGPGGIREAEFIVQALQLVRGGSETSLQCRELQTVLPLLVNDRGISAADAEEIRVAYRFLRRLENFIQAIRDEQTHDLPEGSVDQARLCLALGFATWADLCAELNHQRNAISAQFNAVAATDQAEVVEEADSFEAIWGSEAGIDEWRNFLLATAGKNALPLAENILAFASSPATKSIDSISRQRLRRFFPRLLERVIASQSPALALSRSLAVTERILRRSAYIALLNENPHALANLIDLCTRSQYIADQIARYPVLLDELLDPRIYSGGVNKDDLLSELAQRLDGGANEESETRMHTIVQFQRAEMFRIAVADFNDQLPIMKVSDGLTWLAEVVLAKALETAWNDLAKIHGEPRYVVDGDVLDAGFGIVAYGKLGGLELSYGSDLDIVFLHDSTGTKQLTDGDKPLDNVLFFARLVRRLVHFLTTQTGSGALYEIDTRLRPDGRSGLLVTSIEAFEKYQVDNAWTWEHQALLRGRAVAGHEKVIADFDRIRTDTLRERVRRDTLRTDVISMRKKMRSKLDASTDAVFDLKHGSGGIGDVEFLVQYLVLLEAGNHSSLTAYSDNIRQLDALVAEGVVEERVGRRLQDIYREYRRHAHRLMLDGQAALVDSSLFRPERDAVVSAWSNWLTQSG